MEQMASVSTANKHSRQNTTASELRSKRPRKVLKNKQMLAEIVQATKNLTPADTPDTMASPDPSQISKAGGSMRWKGVVSTTVADEGMVKSEFTTNLKQSGAPAKLTAANGMLNTPPVLGPQVREQALRVIKSHQKKMRDMQREGQSPRVKRCKQDPAE